MSRRFVIFAAIIVAEPLLAKLGEEPDYGVAGAPWFTGPLLAPSSNVIPVGHFGIEPYVFAIANTGSYGNHWQTTSSPTLWNIAQQTLFGVGITQWMSFQLTTTAYWNYCEGAAHFENGDWYAQFDMQLFRPREKTSFLPTIKFTLRETIPLGRYRNLQFRNLKTDIGGAGSWISTAALVFGKLSQIRGVHFFSLRMVLSLNVPTPVNVKGLNVYGGGYGTHGTVYPGIFGVADFAFEYCLSRNWVLAMDVVGQWNAKSRFSGKAGTLPTSGAAHVGSLASVEYSLAPAIEYNWDEHIGLIAGSWFSVAGKNTAKFTSGVIALSYYH